MKIQIYILSPPHFSLVPWIPPFRRRVTCDSGEIRAEGIPSCSLVKLWICSCLFAIPKHWSHRVHSSVLQRSRTLFSARFYSGHCKICWEREVFVLWSGGGRTPWTAPAVPLEPLSGSQVGTDPGNLPQLLPRGCHGGVLEVGFEMKSG